MKRAFLHTGLLACGAFATTLLAGCATQMPYWESHFGEAVDSAIAQQTLYPDAWKSHSLANGIDGKAAQETMGRYYDSFKTPPPPLTVFNFGVGSGAGGSGQ
jgi:hypothetical protein